MPPKPQSAKTKAKASKSAGAKPRKAKPAAVNGKGIAPTVIVDEKSMPEKDPQTGRFLPGNNGGPGRPPGAKNKLVEDFLTDFHEAWVAHGRTALESMVEKEPSSFVRAAVQLMPKDVLVDARGVGLVVVRLDDTDMKL
jgi:hypothetical protein